MNEPVAESASSTPVPGGWLRRLIEPPAPAHLRQELHVEIAVRITALQGMVAAGYAFSCLSAAWYVASSGVSLAVVLPLIVPTLLTALFSLRFWLRYRNGVRPKHISDMAIWRIFRAVFVFGVVWGAVLATLGLYAGKDAQTMMLLIACGITGACITFLYYLPAAALAFGLLCVTPPTLVLALNGWIEALALLPLYVAYAGLIFGSTFSSYRSFLHNLTLRVDNEELRIKAEAANDAKTEFIASISHELRTPLNAIYGFAQLMMLDEGKMSAREVQASAVQIMESGKYLLSLVEDILDVAALDSDAISFSKEPVASPQLFRELLSMIEVPAQRKSLHVRVGSDVDAEINVDRRRLKQILANFLSNAVKYNREGGSVEIGCRITEEGWLRSYVCDTGIGILPEEQHKVFERFGRATQSIAVVEGAGIGLYYARRLARMMGGHTGFESEPGKGSTFWVDFPLLATASP